MKIKMLLTSLALAMVGTAHADLHERLGGAAYYDDVLDITWLTDANLAKTETFGIPGIDQHFASGGAMSWETAHEWITALNASNHLGFNDWRLPAVRPVDGVAFNDAFSAVGATDLGYANYEGWKDAQGNPTSELAYMYYVNLGNIGRCKPDPTLTSSCFHADTIEDDWGLKNRGPFANLFSGPYWTGAIGPFPDRFPDHAWRVTMSQGSQDWTGGASWVWAVRDGDVGGAPANEPPVAVAGPDQSVRAGDTVFLDGSASYDDNTASADLAFAWTISVAPSDSSATLQAADTATPLFVVDIPGTFVIKLVVTDEGGLASDPAYVTVSSTNLAPTAIAFADPEIVVVGEPVVLDGNGSFDPENDPLSFQWTLASAPVGSAAAIIDDDAPLALLIPDIAGTYLVSLTVGDHLGPGMPVEFEIVAVADPGVAEGLITSAAELLASLSPAQVTTRGNRIALGNFLRQALEALQEGDVAEAKHKLQQAISRTDGCALRGAPDRNGPDRDWVTDCDAQLLAYLALSEALDALNN